MKICRNEKEIYACNVYFLNRETVGYHSHFIHTLSDLYSPPNVFFFPLLCFVQVCNMAGALVESETLCQVSYFPPPPWHKYDNRFFELWLQRQELDSKNPLKVTQDWATNTSSFCARRPFPTGNWALFGGDLVSVMTCSTWQTVLFPFFYESRCISTAL